MLDIREFSEELNHEYSDFCKRNISRSNYQSKSHHISWLREYEKSFFKVAVNKNQIVGCLHGFMSPLILNGKVEMAMNLHNLYSDPSHRGIGMKLLMNSVREENQKILAHATGKLAIAYEKLGSIKVKSSWAKKFVIPHNIYNNKRIIDEFLDRKFLKSGFLITSNKDLSKKTIFLDKLKGLNIFKEDLTDNFMEWRFGHDNSPITFLVEDLKTKNSLLFSIGKRGFIPFVRIFSFQLMNIAYLSHLLNCVENYASYLGIPIIIISVTNDLELDNFGYKAYKVTPEAYYHSNEKKILTEFNLDCVSTDVAFNGYI